MKTQAIVLHPDDNVATALEDIAAGETIVLKNSNIEAIEAVPFGHKIALSDISIGGVILKYGESIGIATGDIKEGTCVHVHNVDSQRGRGDRGKSS